MVQLNPVPVFCAKKNTSTIWTQFFTDISVQMVSTPFLRSSKTAVLMLPCSIFNILEWSDFYCAPLLTGSFNTNENSPKPFINLKNVVQKPKRNQKKKTSKDLKRFLAERIIFTNTGHVIFIMLKKKSLTTHLLLTNPTAVFLNDDRLCFGYTIVSGFSQCLLDLCKACGPDINVFTSCSLPFTGFQSFGQTFVFLGKFKWPFLSVESFMTPQVSCLVKTLATLFTFIRLFPSVNSFMSP